VQPLNGVRVFVHLGEASFVFQKRGIGEGGEEKFGFPFFVSVALAAAKQIHHDVATRGALPERGGVEQELRVR
jgi:hypothetical protein